MAENISEAQKLEKEIHEKTLQLAELRRKEPGVRVPDYSFQTLAGKASLSGLFGEQKMLLAIHNMGQGCRYCTLWADGINGVLEHLENVYSVVLLSKDPPQVQRRMALDRGWRFQAASHGGGDYMIEQSVGEGNSPGAVIFELRENQIFRRGSAAFGPYDLYSPFWHFLALAGLNGADRTPQYHYWKRPAEMDDGGDNIIE